MTDLVVLPPPPQSDGGFIACAELAISLARVSVDARQDRLAQRLIGCACRGLSNASIQALGRLLVALGDHAKASGGDALATRLVSLAYVCFDQIVSPLVV